MALWAFVLAFVFGPLGLIFSIIGLSQVGKRRERGRGLALAGLVVSVLWLAAGVWFAVAVGLEVADQLRSGAGITDESVEDVVGKAPAVPAPTTVLEACNTMMPVFGGAEQQMAAAATPTDAIQIMADMRATVVWAGAVPDAGFQQHLQLVATDLTSFLDASSTGELAPGLTDALGQHTFAVGKDCGLSGWTP
jgi:peptidyl-prolyl cis-trans isomerase B (cyclophilin B)